MTTTVGQTDHFTTCTCVGGGVIKHNIAIVFGEILFQGPIQCCNNLRVARY